MDSFLKLPDLIGYDHRGKTYTNGQLLEKVRQLAFCITDQNGHFVEVNEAYTEFYGYAEEELIGKHFAMVVPPEQQAYAAQMHDDFITSGLEMPQEWTVQSKSGQLLKIYVEALRMENPDGSIHKLTIIDILTP